MNKKAFLNPLAGISFGVIVAMIIGILILVGGVFAFAISNKFIILGSLIIILSLVYGLKTESFTKQRGKFVFIFMILGVFIFMLGSTPLQNSIIGESQTYYVDNPTVGMLTYKIYTPSLFDKIFSGFGKTEQAAFGKTSLYVGESTTIYDTIPSKVNGQFVNKVIFGIYKDGNRIGIYNVDNWNNDGTNKKMSVTYNVQIAGTYRAITELYTGIAQNLCTTVTPCNAMSYSAGSNNELKATIKPEIVTCSDSSGWGSWVTYQNIDNGIIKYRKYSEVQEDCTKDVTNTEYKTVCNSGFIITGTEGSTGSGKLSCSEKVVVIEPPIVQPPIDDSDTDIPSTENTTENTTVTTPTTPVEETKSLTINDILQKYGTYIVIVLFSLSALGIVAIFLKKKRK